MTNHAIKIGVLGAAGGTGKAFVNLALDAGHHVSALVRTPSKIEMERERLTVTTADVRNQDSLVTAFQGLDAVAAMFGTTDFSHALKPSDLYSTGGRNIVAAMQ